MYAIQVVPYRADTLEPIPVRAVPPFPGNLVQHADVGVRLPFEVAPRAIDRPLDLLASLLAR